MQPEILLAIVMLLAITLYAVLGGADFGAGVWEFTTALQSSEKQRRHVYTAIGPVWEANHVWIIFVMVILMNGFPSAFAGLSRALWIPLLLAVFGIIFRGVGYIFRSYSNAEKAELTVWEAVFAVASTCTPMFLGAAAGAIASGNLAVKSDGAFGGDYLTGWLSGFAIFTGFFTIGICAYLSAVFLAREASVAADEELTEVWRGRSLAVGLWMGIFSIVGLVLVFAEVPSLASGFQSRGWPLVIASMLCGAWSLVALWKSHFGQALIASVGAVATVIWGWGISQYPILISSEVTIPSAAAPAHILWMMLAVISLGTVIMLPALGYLFWLFKSKPAVGE